MLLELKDTLFQDDTIFQIFTGNPKDDHTKQREEMDPAILREPTGVEVNYMPASEMFNIIKTTLITKLNEKDWFIGIGCHGKKDTIASNIN